MNSTAHWRCKRCGQVFLRSGRCPLFACWNVVDDMEPVVVLPVAEYERLRGIEVRLKDNVLIQAHYSLIDELFSPLDYRRAVLGEVEK